MILLASTLCAFPILKGFMSPLTLLDESTIAHAQVRCAELYPASPCAKIIIKGDNLAYRVTCGAPDDKK